MLHFSAFVVGNLVAICKEAVVVVFGEATATVAASNVHVDAATD